MGQVVSASRNHFRRFILRFNIENRTHKFLEKGKLPMAPRHQHIDLEKLYKAKPELRKEIEEMNIKDEKLNDYLKKVYLISTGPVGALVKSERPLPLKRTLDKSQMFFEPLQAEPGHATLTTVVTMMAKFQEDPELWNPTNLSKAHNLDKDVVVKLLINYSLYRKENFDFMNKAEAESEMDQQIIDFETYTQLEKKPVKQIEGKK